MRKISKPTVAVFAGLGAIALTVAPSFASGSHGATSAEAPIQLAHAANRGQQNQGGMNPGQQGQGMNPGQQGQGMNQGQGMMNPGQQGQGMMGGGMMNMMNMMRQHMMGQPMMGQGAMGQPMTGQGTTGSSPGMGMGFGGQVIVNKDLSTDDVSHFLGHRLEAQGNERLTLGDVTEVDEDKITADINTVDGSLVKRLEIDRHSGMMRHMQQSN